MLQTKNRKQVASGFTLLELLITLAIAGILLTAAIPAMHGIIRKDSVMVARDKLIGALSYTRSAAVNHGQKVILCKSANGQTCTTNGDWAQGWIVYVPNTSAAEAAVGQILRVQSELDGQIHISGNAHVVNNIAYNPMGFAYGSNGTLTIASDSGNHTVKIIISNTGRVRVDYH